MRLPRAIELEALDWFSRRGPVRGSTVPPAFRPSMHKLVWEGERRPELAWLRRDDVVLFTITDVGRGLASAYRQGRAALASQLEATQGTIEGVG